jgi:hypothetical protein
MKGEVPTRAFVRTTCLFLGTLLCAVFLAQPANSQNTAKSGVAIPAGTILPVRLNSTISSAKCKPGQAITGRIMQDILLPQGARIREGSKVIGHIVEVTPATRGVQARVSLQFDKLIFSHQIISMTTNLRAIAGFMRILEAQTPPIGPSESDVYRWLTTVQVGGDVVYGEGGVVTAGDNANEVVGKQVNGGVLVRVRAREGTKCQGPSTAMTVPRRCGYSLPMLAGPTASNTLASRMPAELTPPV